MKHLFAPLLAVSMAASLSIGAAAATDLSVSPAAGNGAGDYTIGVGGSYVIGANAKEVISVDIAWEKMDFTYDKGKGVYDAEDHKTTYPDAAWSDDKAGITVTNHSNAEVTATFGFARAAGVTAIGTFYTKSDATYTAIATAAEQKISLGSAEGKATAAAPAGALYFGVSGDGIGENEALGTITVTIAGPKWTEVTTENELKNALTAGGNVRLGANIDLSACLDLTDGDTPVSATLDLNGHTLTATHTGTVISVFDQNALTVQDTAGGGTIVQKDVIQVGNGGSLHIKGGTIRSDAIDVDAVWVKEGGSLTVSGGVLSGTARGVTGYDNSEISIAGGTIDGRLAVLSYGKITVSGGTLTGAFGALQCSGGNGSLTVTGGSFNGDGSSAVAAVIDAATATISGGMFNGSVENEKILTISGGTFVGKIENSDAGTVTISGGTFATDPTLFLPEGYTATQNGNGAWTVSADA